MMFVHNRNKNIAPRHTLLSGAVACALALSLGATAHAGEHLMTADGWPEKSVSPTPDLLPAADMEAFSEEDAAYPIPNPFAEQDELISAIASGEIDVAPYLQELAARENTAPSGDGAVIAATRVVSNCADSGPGSLRAAVNDSQNNDVIDLGELTCSTITLSSPLLIQRENLTLKGKWLSEEKYLAVPTISTTASNTLGLLVHNGTGTLELEKLVIKNGTKYDQLLDDAMGGCIYSMGSVSLRDTTISNCKATANPGANAMGGAVYAERGIKLDRSRVSTSKATAGSGAARGGGLFTPQHLRVFQSTINNNEAITVSGSSSAGGASAGNGAHFDRSTVSGNAANVSGGMSLVSATGAPVNIKHTTVSGNVSHTTGRTAGAFVDTSGDVRIANSTFTNNTTHTSASGPGLVTNGGTVELMSNIISGNRYKQGSSTYFVDAEFRSPVTGTHNLIGTLRDISKPAPADTIRQVQSPLGALMDNGGPTMTHAPTRGSWAFNHGKFQFGIIGYIPHPDFPGGLPVFEPSTDQTNRARTVGADTDIGAYESDALFIGRFDPKPRF